MTQFDRRLQKLRDGPKSVRWEDLKWVMVQAGFACRPGTKHRSVFTHTGLPGLRWPVPAKSPVRVT